MLITPQNLEFLYNQFQTDYQAGFGKHGQIWTKIAERMPSSTELNTYGWLGDLPGFREWVGPRIMHSLGARSYTIINKDWESSFEIPRNKIEDDQFGIYSQSASLLGGAAARLWDDLAIKALKAGHTTVGPDGQFFFDTDHPVNPDDASMGVYSNNFAATLDAPGVASAIAKMQGFVGETGTPLGVNPSFLLCAPQRRAEAFAACKAASYAMVVTNLAGTENVATTAVPNPNEGLLEPLVMPQLADTPGVYFILSVDRLKPLVVQVRKEPEIVARFAPTMDNVFHRKMFEYGADARGNTGYTLPFLAVRCTG